MTIENLRVAQLSHFKRQADVAGNAGTGPSDAVLALPSYVTDRAFFLGTCQRSLWVYAIDDQFSGSSEDLISSTLQMIPGVRIFEGAAAYQLLLSVACGLESQILGETNIFGQVKEAWDRFSKMNPGSELTSIFHKLFEDTKDIRSQFLRNSGGTCYGSLVRQMLRRNHATGPVLVLGAGDIAQTVGPWLVEHEVWIINRDAERAEVLRAKIAREPGARVRVIGKDEEAEAFAKAAHLVVCIPFDAVKDVERIRMWNPDREDRKNSLIIHLSGPRAQAGAWSGIFNFHCLDELFAIQEDQGEFKAAKIAQARKACAHRAKLRDFGSSLSIAHGWEYLAAFC